MADIYFDFDATNNGDGTTAAEAAGAGATGAYNTTDGVSPVEHDIWWVRRSGEKKTITNSIFPVSNFSICGWPMIGDENYDDRPASGTANGWDTDIDLYGEMYRTNNILNYVSTTTPCNGFYTSRMWYEGNSSAAPVTFTGKMRGSKFIKCQFHNLSVQPTYPAMTMYGTNVLISDCVFGGGSTEVAIAKLQYLYSSTVTNCTFNFGMSLSYCENTVFSNCEQVLEVDKGHAQAFLITSMDNCKFENMTIDNSIYTGTSGPVLISGGTTANNTIDIKVVGGTYNTVNFSGQYNSYSIVPATSGDTITGTTIDVSGNDNYCLLENFTGTGVTVTGTSNAVFLKNCVIPDNDFVITSSLRSMVYSLNHGGVAGFWKAFGNEGIIESSDVYRTGGSTHSLRCMLEQTNNNHDCFPTLGVKDLGETIVLDLVAGAHTITMYGAHRLFADNFSKGELFIEADWVDSNGVKTTSNSIMQGRLESDASVWVGDSDLTVFKIPLTITIPTDQLVPLRVLGTYDYENNAYFYLDPVPVLT